MSKQEKFFQSKEDSFLILQLTGSEETADEKFMNFDWLVKHGKKPDPGHYDAVYCGHLMPGTGLDGLYYRFNMEKPKDFTGHSLSVSDIVALKQSGSISCYYVDSIGFKKLDDFQLKDTGKQKNLLKPCPFCGNPKPRIMHWNRKICVICDGMYGCGASSGKITYSLDNGIAEVTKEDLKKWSREVTAWWNRRAGNQ